MDIRAILSTLRRHKIAALLIVVEVALTCAIVANAVHLIAHRIERMNAPSGMADNELLRLQLTALGKRDEVVAQTRRDLAALRNVPGVKAVTLVNQVPFGNSAWSSGVQLQPKQARESLHVGIYGAAEDFLAATGLR